MHGIYSEVMSKPSVQRDIRWHRVREEKKKPPSSRDTGLIEEYEKERLSSAKIGRNTNPNPNLR